MFSADGDTAQDETMVVRMDLEVVKYDVPRFRDSFLGNVYRTVSYSEFIDQNGGAGPRPLSQLCDKKLRKPSNYSEYKPRALISRNGLHSALGKRFCQLREPTLDLSMLPLYRARRLQSKRRNAIRGKMYFIAECIFGETENIAVLLTMTAARCKQ